MNFTPLEANIFEDLSFMEGCSLKDIIDEALDKHTCKCNKASKPTVCKIEGHLTTELSLNEIIFLIHILFYSILMMWVIKIM